MSKHYRIGIVGIGSIAETHARAIAEIDGAELVAGSCRTEDKGRRFAEQFGCRWFADFQSLIDEMQPDVITVCTPSGALLRRFIAALSRVNPSFATKPLLFARGYGLGILRTKPTDSTSRESPLFDRQPPHQRNEAGGQRCQIHGGTQANRRQPRLASAPPQHQGFHNNHCDFD